ncbi:hypothetical protein D3C85_1231520 [compost metagenome]
MKASIERAAIGMLIHSMISCQETTEYKAVVVIRSNVSALSSVVITVPSEDNSFGSVMGSGIN